MAQEAHGITVLSPFHQPRVWPRGQARIRMAAAMQHGYVKSIPRQARYDFLHRQILGVRISGARIGGREDFDRSESGMSHLGLRIV